MDSNLSDLSKSGKQSGARPIDHSIIGSDDKFKLFCWILSKSNGAFLINIGKSEMVSDLRAAIRKENEHTLVGIDLGAINIWKGVILAGID